MTIATILIAMMSLLCILPLLCEDKAVDQQHKEFIAKNYAIREKEQEEYLKAKLAKYKTDREYINKIKMELNK